MADAHGSDMRNKLALGFKLFLLEDARKSVDRVIRNFIHTASEEVQPFLNSPMSASRYCELVRGLDARYRALNQLLRAAQDITHDAECVGTLLRNAPVSRSLTGSVQAARQAAALTLNRLKQFFRPETAENDALRGGEYGRVAEAVGSPASLGDGGKGRAPADEEEFPKEAEPPPPPPPLPPVILVRGRTLPELPAQDPCYPLRRRTLAEAPPAVWGLRNDVAVHHQKQTASQLLNFLRANVENRADSITEWRNDVRRRASPRSTPPSASTVELAEGGPAEALPPTKDLAAQVESQTPVFRLKRLHSGGSPTYTCVIATEKELWDVADVLETRPGIETTDRITIPAFQVCAFKEMEVVVSHIVTPGNMYVQCPDIMEKQEALMKDWGASGSFAEENSIPDIGSLVMGFFSEPKQWCRAQVMKICGMSGDPNTPDGAGSAPSIKVEVLRLDHGDTARLSLRNVWELTPTMAVLPLQAVQVSLANVTPVEGTDWSADAVAWFRAAVNNRKLYARFYPRGANIAVELFLEKGKMGFMRRGPSLSLRLAQNGHAKHHQLKDFGRSRGKFQHQMKKQECLGNSPELKPH